MVHISSYCCQADLVSIVQASRDLQCLRKNSCCTNYFLTSDSPLTLINLQGWWPLKNIYKQQLTRLLFLAHSLTAHFLSFPWSCSHYSAYLLSTLETRSGYSVSYYSTFKIAWMLFIFICPPPPRKTLLNTFSILNPLCKCDCSPLQHIPCCYQVLF